MTRPIVKLKLDVESFEEAPFRSAIQHCEKNGIVFKSMASLGDTSRSRHLLYELNRTCSKDIPARGKFFTYEEFSERRYGKGYDPNGVIIALHDGDWVGLTANSNWKQRGFVFNEMTGVLRHYRRKGIALALKLHGIRYAKRLPVQLAFTLHDAENVAPIQMNRKIGYVDTEWNDLFG